MMFAEEFFEQIAANLGDFLLLIIAMVINCVLWVLPFVIVFSPIYYDDLIERFFNKE